MRDQNAALQVHDGYAPLGSAQHKRQRTVWQDGYVLWLSHDGNAPAQGESRRVMDAQRPVMSIHYQNGLTVWRDTRTHRFAPGPRAREDGVGFNVHRQQRVVARSRATRPRA